VCLCEEIVMKCVSVLVYTDQSYYDQGHADSLVTIIVICSRCKTPRRSLYLFASLAEIILDILEQILNLEH
jgi:hypothetical protein